MCFPSVREKEVYYFLDILYGARLSSANAARRETAHGAGRTRSLHSHTYHRQPREEAAWVQCVEKGPAFPWALSRDTSPPLPPNGKKKQHHNNNISCYFSYRLGWREARVSVPWPKAAGACPFPPIPASTIAPSQRQPGSCY